jgi:hypothetical protein
MGELVLHKQGLNNQEFKIEIDTKGILFLRVSDKKGNIYATKLISR